MKVVSSKTMSHLESLAYRDGASETDFMEEAGSGVALVAHDFAERNLVDRIVYLLCGKGNNAGDAYVAGFNLLQLEYEVHAVAPTPIAECSPLCKQHYERFVNEGGRMEGGDFEFPPSGIIIDGIFGTGFRGSVKEPYASLIRKANNSKLPIIAIDIPSGLDGETGQAAAESIIATETAFLGLPKTGFFLLQGWDHVGKLRYIDFGLPKQYIEECPSDLIMLSEDMLKDRLPVIKRSRHKYAAGFVVGLAGSPGMPGAAILSSTAALRGGAGIVKLLHPDGMQLELNTTPYELIKVPFQYGHAGDALALMNSASSTFVGPGMGRGEQSIALLQEILPQLVKPCVIDADALTILSQKSIALPAQTVMTPHLGELMRLLKLTEKPLISMDFLSYCRRYAEENHVTLVLKGGPTFIFSPGFPIMVNPTGDPGMATAGSGDVLTGLIAALLAQGLSSKDAATLGVFLHGLAGEHAAAELTSYGMMASDIIYHFPEAFHFYML